MPTLLKAIDDILRTLACQATSLWPRMMFSQQLMGNQDCVGLWQPPWNSSGVVSVAP